MDSNSNNNNWVVVQHDGHALEHPGSSDLTGQAPNTSFARPGQNVRPAQGRHRAHQRDQSQPTHPIQHGNPAQYNSNGLWVHSYHHPGQALPAQSPNQQHSALGVSSMPLVQSIGAYSTMDTGGVLPQPSNQGMDLLGSSFSSDSSQGTIFNEETPLSLQSAQWNIGSAHQESHGASVPSFHQHESSGFHHSGFNQHESPSFQRTNMVQQSSSLAGQQAQLAVQQPPLGVNYTMSLPAPTFQASGAPVENHAGLMLPVSSTGSNNNNNLPGPLFPPQGGSTGTLQRGSVDAWRFTQGNQQYPPQIPAAPSFQHINLPLRQAPPPATQTTQNAVSTFAQGQRHHNNAGEYGLLYNEPRGGLEHFVPMQRSAPAAVPRVPYQQIAERGAVAFTGNAIAPLTHTAVIPGPRRTQSAENMRHAVSFAHPQPLVRVDSEPDAGRRQRRMTRAALDRVLLRGRDEGMSYGQIKSSWRLHQSEATLRSRHRSLLRRRDEELAALRLDMDK